jgi:hypothetical protein
VLRGCADASARASDTKGGRARKTVADSRSRDAGSRMARRRRGVAETRMARRQRGIVEYGAEGQACVTECLYAAVCVCYLRDGPWPDGDERSDLGFLFLGPLWASLNQFGTSVSTSVN